jgi:hypothetical protein
MNPAEANRALDVLHMELVKKKLLGEQQPADPPKPVEVCYHHHWGFWLTALIIATIFYLLGH